MHDKLKILLDKINLDEKYYSYFIDGKLEKVIINKEAKKSCFVLSLKNTLPLDIYLNFKDKVINTFRDSKIDNVSINITYDVINYDLLSDYYKDIVNNIGIKASMFKENVIYFDDSIKIEVLNRVEKKKLEEVLDVIKLELLYSGFKSNIEVIINKDKNDEIIKEIESETKEIVISNTEVVNNVILGNDIENVKVNYELRDIIGEDDNVVVECYIFGVDIFESSKSNFKILTLKISDNTDSIHCKVFSKDSSEFSLLCDKLKVGKWIKVRGYTKNDQYSRDLV